MKSWENRAYNHFEVLDYQISILIIYIYLFLLLESLSLKEINNQLYCNIKGLLDYMNYLRFLLFIFITFYSMENNIYKI